MLDTASNWALYWNGLWSGFEPVNEEWEHYAFYEIANQGSRNGTNLHSSPRHISTMMEMTETPKSKERQRPSAPEWWEPWTPEEPKQKYDPLDEVIKTLEELRENE